MGAIATDAGAPYGLLRFIASNNATFIQSGLSGATGSAAPLYFASMNSGSIWASISATGMMGIGTASSTIPLQVNNNAGTYSTPAASISDGPADLGGTYGMLHLTRPGASSDSKGHLTLIRNGSSVFNIGYFSGTNTVGFVSANNMNSSNGMFIMSTGFVGIGTFTPQSKFHVYNGVTILSSGTTNNNPAYATPTTLHLRGPAATSTQLVWECVNVNTAAITASTGYGLSYGTQGGDHVFRTNCTYNGDFSATGSERFRIASNGNVGINSSVPGYTLDVIGNCRISSILTTPYLSAPDMRSQTNYFKPNHQPSNTFSVGFFGGAASGTWADGIQLNTYSDGSGGSQNLVLFQKNGIGMRIYQGGWQANSSYVSYMDAIMKDSSGNVNIGGGTLTVGSLVVGSGVLIPYGIIVMWYGSAASVPAGWALCNGGSGTPNLQDRFVIAAGSGYYPGQTGGANEITLSVGQLPSHTHSMPDLRHDHTGATRTLSHANSGGCDDQQWGTGNRDCGWAAINIFTNATTWAATGTSTPPGSLGYTGSGQAIENRPLFYALCYIMKI
jgi:microcystin-dependent protein